MLKRVLVVPVIAIVLFVSFINIARIAINMNNKADSSLIPVEKITGINERVKLKDGCFVTSGTSFASNDNGVRCHCMRMTFAETIGSNIPGLPVDNLRIIDVYGDKCTLVFNCTDDHKLYVAGDYPLANLEYNESKVNKADDGIHTNLIGTGYTIDPVPSPAGVAINIVELIGTWIVGVIIIGKLLK